jgi:hypothetical protein
MTEKPEKPEKPGKLQAPPKRDFARLFHLAEPPEQTFDMSHLLAGNEAVRSTAESNFLDLADRRKVVFVTGAGNVGKTLLLRWMIENAQTRGADLAFATSDTNRDLPLYFEGTIEGAGHRWLSQLLSWSASETGDLVVGLGGGDRSLVDWATTMPGLAQQIENWGLTPVLFVVLSSRSRDLAVLEELRTIGFLPKTTALVMNLGRVVDGPPEPASFKRVTSHSLTRDVLGAGAAQIWMPKLFRSADLDVTEERHLSFQDARLSPEIWLADRSHITGWLGRMDVAFDAVKTWLP